MTNFAKFSVPLLLGLALISIRAQGFPENTRHGYVSCASCHVSPSGGAILNRYGRYASADAIAGSAREGEAAFAYGMFPSLEEKGSLENLNLAANLRTLHVYSDRGAYHQYRNILMQADLQVAYSLKQFTFAAEAGLFGSTFATPFHYVMYQPSKEFSFRAGRFYPNVGVMVPDHRVGTRRGLGMDQNQQTYNVEAAYLPDWGQVFLTAILAPFPGEDPGSLSGFAVRPAIYLGNSQLGVSYSLQFTNAYKRHSGGPFTILAFSPSLYLLADLQTRWESPRVSAADISSRTGIYSYLKFGWEFTKGYHLYLTQDSSVASWKDRSTQGWSYYGFGFQFLPRPHLDGTFQIGARRIAALSSRYGPEVALTLHFML